MGYEYEWMPGLPMRRCVFSLNDEQVAMILPLVKKQRDLCKARYDKARDIVDGGEATPRQVTDSGKAEDEFGRWDALYHGMKGHPHHDPRGVCRQEQGMKKKYVCEKL